MRWGDGRIVSIIQNAWAAFANLCGMVFNINMMKPTIINPQTYQQNLLRCLDDAGRGDLWVFAYGSLMIRPGFRPTETAAARLYGYSRRLAVRSMHYRGTLQQPGLVFGLDVGGSCNGVLLRVAAAHKERTIRALFRREMFADVYDARFVRAQLLLGNRTARALAFVSRHDNVHYVPQMPLAEVVPIILSARGFGGRNVDYILDAHRELVRRGVACPQLARLCRALQK